MKHLIYRRYKTVSSDRKRELEYDVYIDFETLADMARKAAANKGRQATDGPLHVVVTGSPLYDPEAKKP